MHKQGLSQNYTWHSARDPINNNPIQCTTSQTSAAALPGAVCAMLVPKAGKDEALAAGCDWPKGAGLDCSPKLKPPPVDAAACDWPNPKPVLRVPNPDDDCEVACCPKAGVAADWLCGAGCPNTDPPAG